MVNEITKSCSFCGNNVTAEDAFCNNCGASLTEEVEITAEMPVVVEQPTSAVYP
ncbi:MAG: hypothetical protein KGD59_10635 [Candidatus Heimdallarchaeota archaeon]|nr:hypothetical protein [Candidatus Heimdallarchaeota archaeon]MBY8994995.1 hypothetical protein [Candidatus Heimdallarchaeota archaeon]